MLSVQCGSDLARKTCTVSPVSDLVRKIYKYTCAYSPVCVRSGEKEIICIVSPVRVQSGEKDVLSVQCVSDLVKKTCTVSPVCVRSGKKDLLCQSTWERENAGIIISMRHCKVGLISWIILSGSKGSHQSCHLCYVWAFH